MHDLKDWLARFYARSDIEDLLDRDKASVKPSRMLDIWDGEALRSFRGPDGGHFLDRPRGEGRLVFSINTDGFNPLSNKQNGKQISCSAIYMVCLNLPPHLRYRLENAFLVGVIPGPKEPSIVQMNHLLRPLVDVLMELWSTGLFLKRTPRYPFGRRTRVVVVPLVADLPAARKMAGFGSYNSTHFCSCCHNILDDKDDIDTRTWVPRTLDTHYKNAQAWRDAPTLKEQERLFGAAGVRWSELLRLPYWDPTLYTAIDSMHCFYLGLFHHHVLNIWGMKEDGAEGPGATYDDLTKKHSPVDLNKARSYLECGDFKNLENIPKQDLVHLCFEKNLRFAGRNKAILLKRLREVSPESYYPILRRLTFFIVERNGIPEEGRRKGRAGCSFNTRA